MTSNPLFVSRMGRRCIAQVVCTSAAVLLSCGLALAQEPADRIWSGGPIITMNGAANDASMKAQAVAERDGKIVAVGTVEDVMKLKGDSTQMIDLAGKTMLPGFVDAHGHVLFGGLQNLSANLLAAPDGKVNDIPALQDVLREWVKANEDKVKQTKLIIGFGYDPSQLKEQRHPNKEELDAISTEYPVIIVHQSGHIFTLNSKALEMVKIDATTPNPQGGVIRRKAGSQEPDGVLEEIAGMAAFAKLIVAVGESGFRAFIASGAEQWAKFGYTTAQDGRSTGQTADLVRAVGKEGKLKIDVAIYPDVLIDKQYIRENVSKTYNNRVRVAGAKLTIDGSVQGFTAWRDKPYYDPPKGLYPVGYSGYAAATVEQASAAIDWAFENDIQILTHCNGEAASDLLIASVAAAGQKHGNVDRRSVLIHGQLLREDQIDSLKKNGIIPSLFPMHTFYWGDLHREQTVGPAAANNISPTGWVLQRGMIFTSHHDAPVALPDSFRVLDATVTRRTRSGDILGPEHRVDVITGLKAMTLWPAIQHFEGDTKGSIEVGKLADLIIISADPTAIDPETLDSIKVVQTIKEGQTIYTRDEKAATNNDRLAPIVATALAGITSYREGVQIGDKSHAQLCLSNTILSLTMQATTTGELMGSSTAD
jgi:predicted amidohydrolase YtcJ